MIDCHAVALRCFCF